MPTTSCFQYDCIIIIIIIIIIVVAVVNYLFTPLTVASILPVMVAFSLLLLELSCAVVTSTCVLLQCQPQVVFNMSASYVFCSIGVLLRRQCVYCMPCLPRCACVFLCYSVSICLSICLSGLVSTCMF